MDDKIALMEKMEKKVVADIVRLCRERDEKISQNLACWMARAATIQNPDRLRAATDDVALSELIEHCVEKLTQRNNPNMETIRMQVEVDTAFLAQRDRVSSIVETRDQTAQDLLEESVHIRVVYERQERETLDRLHQRIFEYVAVRNHLPLQTGIDAISEAETRAALESVFPRHGLRRWIILNNAEKADQLQELACIVLGIRLFNRSIKKGGAALRAVSQDYRTEATRLGERLREELAYVRGQIDHYIVVVNFRAQRFRPHDEFLKRLRDELANRQQYMLLLETVQADLQDGLSVMEELTLKYQDSVHMLQDIVGARQSVPKEKVYPHFSSLGSLHLVMSEELELLSARSTATDSLFKFHQPFTTELRSTHVHEAHSRSAVIAPYLTDDFGPRDPDDMARAEADAGVERLNRGRMEKEEYENLRPEFNRFCPVTLVKRGGLLLLGEPDLGLLRFSRKVYTSFDVTYQNKFAASPESYLEAVHEMVRDNLHLVRILGLQREDMFHNLDISEIAAANTETLPCDFGTQTPTHFVEHNIDYSYDWNEWALRRRALQLANLRNKATHSAQTDASHFRREGQTQVWLPKDSTTQTPFVGTSKVAKKIRFVEGLRGAPETKMNVVNLTLEI